MIASFKNLVVVFFICLTIAGCGNQKKINELQTQLDSCKAQVDTNYNAWASKKQALDLCTDKNNNLYNFIADQGTILDRTAKFFTIYPWQSIIISLFLVISSIVIGMNTLIRHARLKINTKFKEAKKTIEKAKSIRQKLSETEGQLANLTHEINTLNLQKISIVNEVNELTNLNNLDINREKKLIIDSAKSEAGLIIDEAHDQASRIIEEANQIKEQALEEKAKTEQIRQSLIDNY